MEGCDTTAVNSARRRTDQGESHASYNREASVLKFQSSQFFLLAGSTLLLLLVTVSSVGLLSKVGAEPLPSTLAAMGGGHGGHAKRD